MRRILLSLTVLLGLIAAAKAADIIELRHRDLKPMDSYDVWYLCLDPETVKTLYPEPRYKLPQEIINADDLGMRMKSRFASEIYVTTPNCLKKAMPGISIFVREGFDDFSVTTLSN